MALGPTTHKSALKTAERVNICEKVNVEDLSSSHKFEEFYRIAIRKSFCRKVFRVKNLWALVPTHPLNRRQVPIWILYPACLNTDFTESLI